MDDLRVFYSQWIHMDIHLKWNSVQGPDQRKKGILRWLDRTSVAKGMFILMLIKATAG
jgi:hypothetical protein